MSGIYENSVPEDLDPVPVHIYSHPDWDMKLILLAGPNTREQAMENLGDVHVANGERHNDPYDLKVAETTMPRDEFVNLPEFDG